MGVIVEHPPRKDVVLGRTSGFERHGCDDVVSTCPEFDRLVRLESPRWRMEAVVEKKRCLVLGAFGGERVGGRTKERERAQC